MSKNQAFKSAFGDDIESLRIINQTPVTFEPLSLIDLKDRLVLISSGTIKDACHGCYGYMGIHYFKNINERWVLDGEWIEQFSGTSWGGSNTDWTISKYITGKPLLFYDSSFMGQGHICTTTHMIALNPEKPLFVGSFLSNYSNSGTGATPIDISTRVVGSGSEQLFGVAYFGRMKGKQFQTKRFFSWKNGKYQPEQIGPLDEFC